MKNNILVVGCCGVGKTWLMLQLIEIFKCEHKDKEKLLRFSHNEDRSINITGNYVDGATFQGSDKLAMNVMSSVPQFLENNKNCINIYEGDRFSNGKFIEKADPIILKILGDGEEGRIKRGSNQTERQLKSITTRVGNIDANLEFNNSTDCLNFILKFVEKYKKDICI